MKSAHTKTWWSLLVAGAACRHKYAPPVTGTDIKHPGRTNDAARFGQGLVPVDYYKPFRAFAGHVSRAYCREEGGTFTKQDF